MSITTSVARSHASDPLSIEAELERALNCGQQERDRLHAHVVESHLGLARAIASRYRDRGEAFDDLMQVANLGLVAAVHRFRPGLGVSFAAYASPTINGELRRHFRDRCWAVRPPRRLQELRPRLRGAQLELQQELKRNPSEHELAARLDVPVAEIREAVSAATGYQVLPLERPGSDFPGSFTLSDHLAGDHREMDAMEARLTIQPLLSRLSAREQRVVTLRFFSDLTQQQIADDLHVSQMHVSRMLSSILQQLREMMEPGVASGGSPDGGHAA